MLGDLKIIRTNRTNPAEENGWHVPPGEDGNTTVYTAASRCDKHLQQGDANKEAGATCGYPDWCLFNITADVCEYVFSYLWGACVHTLGCLGVLCVRYLRVRTHDVLFLSFPFLSFPFPSPRYHNLAKHRPDDVARLVKLLAAYQATAVAPIKGVGCKPVAVNNTKWVKGKSGQSWQPCDGPNSPPPDGP